MWKTNRANLLAFSVPLVALVGMTVSPVFTMMTGKEIQLETKPIDPTDLFRGDYVTLSYQAEEVHESKLDKKIKEYFLQEESKSYGSKPLVVYSILERNREGIYEVKKVVMEKPKSGLYLKGKIVYLWLRTDEEIRKNAKTEEEFQEEKAQQNARIHYSLDNFFVAENTGRALERATNQGKAVATVKVRDGHAILTDVGLKNK